MTPVWLPDGVGEAFLDARLPGGAEFANSRSVGVVDGSSVLVAAVVLHRWSPHFGTIEVSGASDHPRWLNKAVLTTIFDYVFVIADCQAAVGISRDDNEQARRFWLKVGASETTVPHLSGEGQPSSIYVLPRKSWLTSKYRSLP